MAYNNSPDCAGMTHQDNPLSVKFLSRTRRLKNTHLFRTHMSMMKLMDLDFAHNVSLANIKTHMRTLRIKGLPNGPLRDHEVRNIYKDIDTYL